MGMDFLKGGVEICSEWVSGWLVGHARMSLENGGFMMIVHALFTYSVVRRGIFDLIDCFFIFSLLVFGGVS